MAMANGGPANPGRRAAVHGARSIWPWGHRHAGQSGGGVPPSSAGVSEPVSATGSREPARLPPDLPDLPDPPDQIPEGDAIGTVTADAA